MKLIEMKRLLLIIASLFLGIIARGQVFYSNDLTHSKTGEQISGYVELTVNTDLQIVCLNYCDQRVFFKLVDIQVSEKNGLSIFKYTIKNNDGHYYTFSVVADDHSAVMVLTFLDVICQQVTIRRL